MKQNFNLKTMFTLFLAAPFVVLIVMIFFFMGVAESRNMSSRDLEAPKYLIEPLMDVIGNDYKPSGDTGGIILLMDSSGSVIYSPVAYTINYESVKTTNVFSRMLQDGPDNISISHYVYKGEPYFCFFDNTRFPSIYKQKIRIGISLFVVIISCMGLIFGQVSSAIINTSIKKLIEASDSIAEGNLDEKITLKYNNELIHVARAIDRMREELKEKRNVEQRFVMSVTHDLKTPLTSLSGYLEALADGIISDPSEVSQTVELMQTKTNLLESRINELLEYSRSRTAGWRENWKLIPMGKWLSDISSMFGNDAVLYGRKYLENISLSDGISMKGDEKLLTRALENLFDNACRYTEKGDYIIFSASLAEKENLRYVEISIEDSGSGISEEDMGKIFELFYRNDRGRNSRGMGIGLASVRTIVEDHGGTISCSNSESGGARFTIMLEV